MFYVGIGVALLAAVVLVISALTTFVCLTAFFFSFAETLLDGSEISPMPWDGITRLLVAAILAAAAGGALLWLGRALGA